MKEDLEKKTMRNATETEKKKNWNTIYSYLTQHKA